MTSKEQWLSFLAKLPSLFIGLFLFSIGVVLTLYADLGMAPWGVLQVGLTRFTPLSLGQITQLVGLAVLVLGWLMGFPPGFATVMNMFFVGYFMDVIMNTGLLSTPATLVGKLLMLLAGIAVLGAASFLYMNPMLGAGPRDGLMMGLVQKLDRPVSQVRGAIEVTVLVVGGLLGGPVGIGTVISALTVGYAVQFAFKLGGYDRKAKHLNLFDLVKLLR